MMRKIEFKGQPFILTEGGSICTPEQYQNGELSFAVVGEDGNVWQHHKIIGTAADIKIMGEIEDLNHNPGATEKVLLGLIGELEDQIKKAKDQL